MIDDRHEIDSNTLLRSSLVESQDACSVNSKFCPLERFCQIIGGHVISVTIYYLDLSAVDPILNKEKPYVDVSGSFSPRQYPILLEQHRSLVVLM